MVDNKASSSDEFNPKALTAGEIVSLRTEKKSGFPFVSFLVFVLVLPLGFFMGMAYSFQKFHEITEETIESEIQSILEYLSINKSAVFDFNLVKDEIEVLRKKQLNQEIKQEDFLALKNLIVKLESSYEKRRDAQRSHLDLLSSQKRSLSRRVNENTDANSDLKNVVADLYFIRLSDLIEKSLQKAEDKKLLSLPPEQIRQIELMIAQLILLNPQSEKIIKDVYPAIYAFFYPEEKK